MQDRNNIEYWMEKENLEWHTRQFDNPYRITVAFERFLSKYVNIDGISILDIACGSGGGTAYIAERHPTSTFTGIDINTRLFEFYKSSCKNIKFEYGDIYRLDEEKVDKYKGIICLQTLSWLPECKCALEQMCKLNADWIAFSSLFYEGKINYTISLENYERPTRQSEYSQVYYNIYSVPLITELLHDYGYKNVIYEPFEIDIDIEKPKHKNLGYYTIKTDEGERLAFNTCLYQPEGFICAYK